MIKAPAFQKDAIPPTRGWTHPRTGELLVSRPHSQAQVDEYLGITAEPQVAPVVEVVEEIETDMPIEEEEEQSELEFMTKLELEAMGREHGIELDRREKKSSLIDQLRKAIS